MPTTAEIRDQLDHPVIDADGHLIEFLPLVRDLLRDQTSGAVVDRFDVVLGSSALVRTLTTAERRAVGYSRTGWWGLPAANTLDRATAMLPGLLHDRLDEIGVDLALLYPTAGLMVMALDDAELFTGTVIASEV
jgi:hypothetical protein